MKTSGEEEVGEVYFVVTQQKLESMNPCIFFVFYGFPALQKGSTVVGALLFLSQFLFVYKKLTVKSSRSRAKFNFNIDVVSEHSV